MYCERCDKLVQNEFFYIDQWNDEDEYYYGHMDCDGDYEPQQAGETVEIKGSEWDIRVRIDYCANCGHNLEMRTFTG